MPLPNTRVVHRAFQAHHAPVAEAVMTATVSFVRPETTPGTPTFDEVAGRSIFAAPTDVYSGPCRLQRSPGVASKQPTVGDREVTIREYVVSLPVSVPLIKVNDIGTITACPDDPQLAGQQMRVRDPRHGSILWQRDLLCELYPPVTR
jgi:hypothetical protein